MTAITTVEIKQLSDFQKEIHSVATEREEIDSIFTYVFRKVTWYRLAPEQLKLSMDKEAGNAVYTANSTYHYLMFINKRMILPEMRVSDEYANEYRIAWCHNVNNNNTIQAILKIGDETFNSFDHVWADIHGQYYGKPGFERHLGLAQGNAPFLEEWSTRLPSRATNCIQPFYFSHHPSISIPLFMMSSQTKVTFEYQFRLKVSQLLRLSKLMADKTWRSIKFNPKILSDKCPTQIPNPELWGIYSHVTDAEIVSQTCDDAPKTFYIRNVIASDAENPVALGEKAKVELEATWPTLALFWVAENKDATGRNNRSNYSTDPDNIYNGWNPCSAPTLSYSDFKRFKDVPPDFFEVVEPILHFTSAPVDPGYNAYSICHNSSSIDAEVGVSFGGLKAKLSVPLANSAPFLSQPWTTEHNKEASDNNDDDDEVDGDQDVKSASKSEVSTNGKGSESKNYLLRARMFVMQKVVATKIVESGKRDPKEGLIARAQYSFKLI